MLSKPAVVFPDVIEWACDYLRTALDDATITVAPRAPDSLPARLVTVRDDGGPRAHVTKVASLGVNVWADSQEAAGDLARLVVAHLENATGDGPVVGHVSTSGPLEVLEEGTKVHLYASVDLRVRGDQL